MELSQLSESLQRDAVWVVFLNVLAQQAESGPISGATPAEYDRLLDAVGAWPKHQPIVTLCNCPEDAGAILAAHQLLKAGFLSVRPLLGGYEAWLAANG